MVLLPFQAQTQQRVVHSHEHAHTQMQLSLQIYIKPPVSSQTRKFACTFAYIHMQWVQTNTCHFLFYYCLLLFVQPIPDHFHLSQFFPNP